MDWISLEFVFDMNVWWARWGGEIVGFELPSQLHNLIYSGKPAYTAWELLASQFTELASRDMTFDFFVLLPVPARPKLYIKFNPLPWTLRSYGISEYEKENFVYPQKYIILHA